MKIKEQIIKDVCKNFPIEKIEGLDSKEVKALLFIISQRDVYMLNEAIESYEKEILEMIDNFENRINQFGFTNNFIRNKIIRKQVLEILEEELKSKDKEVNKNV